VRRVEKSERKGAVVMNVVEMRRGSSEGWLLLMKEVMP
jgi:hypothetical protein